MDCCPISASTRDNRELRLARWIHRYRPVRHGDFASRRAHEVPRQKRQEQDPPRGPVDTLQQNEAGHQGQRAESRRETIAIRTSADSDNDERFNGDGAEGEGDRESRIVAELKSPVDHRLRRIREKVVFDGSVQNPRETGVAHFRERSREVHNPQDQGGSPRRVSILLRRAARRRMGALPPRIDAPRIAPPRPLQSEER